MLARTALAAVFACCTTGSLGAREPSFPAAEGSGEAVERLAEEVRGKGWIIFSEQSDKGDYDLFVMRPDGSQRRQITRTADKNEFFARFSPNGKRILFQRVCTF